MNTQRHLECLGKLQDDLFTVAATLRVLEHFLYENRDEQMAASREDMRRVVEDCRARVHAAAVAAGEPLQ